VNKHVEAAQQISGLIDAAVNLLAPGHVAGY
jgi:hypothetical protein